MSVVPSSELIIFGSKPPNLRFSTRGGMMSVFCLNNLTLNLGAEALIDGTYQMGTLLSHLCENHCRPGRNSPQTPCPAFVKSHKVHSEKRNLASIDAYEMPVWEQCGGVRALLDLADTKEERAFLLAYIESLSYGEFRWREAIVGAWNGGWHTVPDLWGNEARRAKFDRLMWATLRYPALIPQAWINWLSGAGENDFRRLESAPSRVDFMAIHEGHRHVVEIDGPTHWASWDGRATFRTRTPTGAPSCIAAPLRPRAGRGHQSRAWRS